MIVNPLFHYACPAAKGTGHVELGQDRPADELAFIRQSIQEAGQLIFHLECHDLLLLRFRWFARHSLFRLRDKLYLTESYPPFPPEARRAAEPWL